MQARQGVLLVEHQESLDADAEAGEVSRGHSRPPQRAKGPNVETGNGNLVLGEIWSARKEWGQPSYWRSVQAFSVFIATPNHMPSSQFYCAGLFQTLDFSS